MLEVAQKEFQKLAEEGEEIFTFDFEPIKGARGKVYQIKFIIYPPLISLDYSTGEGEEEVCVEGPPVYEQQTVNPVITETISKIFCNGEPLTDKNIYDLYNAAGGNIEKIRKAYALLRTQEDVKNTIGWMITAIKEDYETFSSDRHFNYGGKVKADRIWEDYQNKRTNAVQMVTPQVLYEELESTELNRDRLEDITKRYMCISEKGGTAIIYAKECLTLVCENIYKKNINTADKLRLLQSNGYDVIACLNKIGEI